MVWQHGAVFRATHLALDLLRCQCENPLARQIPPKPSTRAGSIEGNSISTVRRHSLTFNYANSQSMVRRWRLIRCWLVADTVVQPALMFAPLRRDGPVVSTFHDFCIAAPLFATQALCLQRSHSHPLCHVIERDCRLCVVCLEVKSGHCITNCNPIVSQCRQSYLLPHCWCWPLTPGH